MFRTDTHPEAQREQVRLFRKALPQQRVAAACSIIQQVRALSWGNLQERMPGATEPERRAAWAELLYGSRLVRALRIGSDGE